MHNHMVYIRLSFARREDMRPYTTRIPVADSYLQALGQVIYNFATTQWNVVYLGSLAAPSFVSRGDVDEIGAVARDFNLLSETGRFPEFAAISTRFSEVTKRYMNLLHTTGLTASDGEQLLGSSDAGNIQWTEADVWTLANDLQTLDIDSNDLFYKLNGNS